jgi:hypothetical protein
MRQFSPRTYMMLARFNQTLAGFSAEAIPADAISSLESILEECVRQCEDYELRASKATAERIGALLSSSAPTYRELTPLFEMLTDRMSDELGEMSFFSLSLHEAGYYDHPRKGWENVITRFPSTIDDIEEAGKCFAFSRYAAVVFHSLQIVEAGLIELGRFLEVSDPKSGWTAVSNALAQVVKKPYERRTPFERDNFEFLEQLHGTVEALKNAWRNKISHVQGKLAILSGAFNKDIAEEVVYATRAFMRRLAEGLPRP